MVARYTPKYTPNAYRKAKTRANKAMKAYKVLRTAYLADRLTLSDLQIEDRLGEMWEARREAKLTRDSVRHIEATGVELGAAWSPRALAYHLARKQGR